MTKGSKTKIKLIKAAMDLFYKKGIHWVSFQQIASKVGIAQPSLYKHFQDKDELIKECALYAAQSGRGEIDRNVDPNSSARDQIFAYLEGNLIWFCGHPKEGTIFMSIYYFGFNNKSIQEFLLTIHEQSVERLLGRLEVGVRAGLWRLDDPRATARIIHDILIGEVFKAIHSPQEMPVSERVKLVWKAVERLLGAGNGP
jgi:AcrR family transcriptional regulator